MKYKVCPGCRRIHYPAWNSVYILCYCGQHIALARGSHEVPLPKTKDHQRKEASLKDFHTGKAKKVQPR